MLTRILGNASSSLDVSFDQTRSPEAHTIPVSESTCMTSLESAHGDDYHDDDDDAHMTMTMIMSMVYRCVLVHTAPPQAFFLRRIRPARLTRDGQFLLHGRGSTGDPAW